MLLQLQSSLRAWVDARMLLKKSRWLSFRTWLLIPDPASDSWPEKLTFATLMPMRAIPFRMVCLLGMNDGEFRSRPPVDFDLMARDTRPGDRSRRDDDRYLFLEALLSAREKLHISWVGRCIQDNLIAHRLYWLVNCAITSRPAGNRLRTLRKRSCFPH